AVAASGAARDDVAPASTTSSYIVVYKDVADASVTTDALEQSLGFKANYRYGSALKGFAADLTQAQLAQVQADPSVAFVSPDGVAPGTRLFAGKGPNASGSGTFGQVICGIDGVAAHGPGTRKNIKVASMSLGGPGPNAAMQTAITNSVNAGITYVVAAGNSNH